MGIKNNKIQKSNLVHSLDCGFDAMSANAEPCQFDMTQLGEALTPASQRRAIEPRVLLDAAGGETAETVIGEVAAEQAAEWVEAITHSDLKESPAVVIPNVEIAFIDSTVENYQSIIDAMGSSTEVVVLKSNTDGVSQIANHLNGRSNISTVHIISHGRSGTLNLGDAKLTAASISSDHAIEMQIIKGSLNSDADILIYGCEFGAGQRGVNAINAFVNATGADVAASNNMTGASTLGGDWDLEITQGTIEASTIEVQNYSQTLEAPLPPTIDLDASDTTATGNDYEETFTENGLPINIAASDAIINDVNNDISGLTITLTTGRQGDLIGIPEVLPGGISVTIAPSDRLQADGTITLSFVGDVATTNADWSLLVQNITLLPSTHNSNDPSSDDRIFTFQVFDVVGAISSIATSTIHVQPVNDPASLDLDADNSSGNLQGGFNGAFAEDSGGAPLHTDLVIGDFDSENLVLANVTFNNPLSSDQLIIDGVVVFNDGVITAATGTANGINYAITLDAGEPVITFSGSHSIADYIIALEAVRFNNTSNNVDTTPRTFDIFVNDGGQDSSTRTSIINILPQNDAPVPLNDIAATDEVTAINIAALDNDSDVDGDTLVIAAINNIAITSGETITLPSGALVTLNGDGSLTYDPNGSFEYLGTGAETFETFTYTVTDHGQSSTTDETGAVIFSDDPISKNAVIEIKVSGLADPISTADNLATLTEDNITGVTGNVITDDDGAGVDSAIDNRGRSTLLWETAGTGTNIVNAPQTVDGVSVSVTVSGSGTQTGEHATVSDITLGAHTGYLVLSQDNGSANSGDAVETTFNFNQPVEDLIFQVLDLDDSILGGGQDAITILAYDANGNLLPVTIKTNTAFVTKVGSAFYSETKNITANEDDGNLYVSISGPVSRIVVQLNYGPDVTATNPAEHSVGISDFSWGNVTANALTVLNIDGVSDDNSDIVGTYGTLNWSADGSYSYTVNPNDLTVQALDDGDAPLQEIFTYTATDEYGQTSQSTLTVNITGLNDAPKINGPDVPNIEDGDYVFPDLSNSDADSITGETAINLGLSFFDIDKNDELSFSITGLPTGLLANEQGQVTGIIDNSASQHGTNNDGVFKVSVSVSDGDDTTIITFNWVIINPAPQIVSELESIHASVDSNVSILTESFFIDPDNDKITYSAEGLPNGVTIDRNTGVISGAINSDAIEQSPNSNGIYLVKIIANDGEGGIVHHTFSYIISEEIPFHEEPVSDVLLPDGPTTNPPSLEEDLISDDIILSDTLNNIDPLGIHLNLDADGNSAISDTIGWIEATRAALGIIPGSDKGDIYSNAYTGEDKQFFIGDKLLSLRTLGTKDRVFLQVTDKNAIYNVEVESINGKPKPAWIDSYSENLLVLTRPATIDAVDIVLNISKASGSEFKIEFKLEFLSGKLVFKNASHASLHQGLSGQMLALNNAPLNEARSLLNTLT